MRGGRDERLRRRRRRAVWRSEQRRDASYIAEGDEPVSLRVILRRPDAITDFGEARLWAETTRADLRGNEVPQPRPGDRVEIDGDGFVVQGEPVRDPERLVWTLELRPA